MDVIVSGTDPQVVERFAKGLRRQPWEVPVPFELALLPEQYLPIRIDEHAMEFTSSVDCCEGGFIAIFLVVPDPAEDDRAGKPVTVNGNTAEVFRDGDISIHIGLPDGSELQVTGSSKTGLDEAQMLKIAEGITVTSAAIPFRSP